MQTLTLTGLITPAPLSGAAVNDYAPPGNNTASRWRLSSTGVLNGEITGIALTGGNVGGRILIIHNVGSTFNLQFFNENVLSAAVNRFLLPGGEDWNVSPGSSAIFVYDETSTRWRGLFSTTILPSTLVSGNFSQQSGDVSVLAGTLGMSATNTATITSPDVILTDGTTSTLEISGDIAMASSTRIDLSGNTAFSGAATGSLLSGTINNFSNANAAGFDTCFELRISTANVTITGFAKNGNPHGATFTIVNLQNSTGTISIPNASAGSAAANRVLTPGGVTLVIPARGTATFYYDGTDDNWRVIATS